MGKDKTATLECHSGRYFNNWFGMTRKWSIKRTPSGKLSYTGKSCFHNNMKHIPKYADFLNEGFDAAKLIRMIANFKEGNGFTDPNPTKPGTRRLASRCDSPV